jgi:hypothetical protein
MTDLAGMPSYFWLTSSRLREPVQDDVPYTGQALREDLLRGRSAWEDCQAKRDRDAIYSYLTAVFDLVGWWAAEGAAIERARKALRIRCLEPSDQDEPTVDMTGRVKRITAAALGARQIDLPSILGRLE